MISKSQIKLINSLSQKKYRNKYGLFVAEGIKVIKELLNSNFELEVLFAEADIFFTEKNKSEIISSAELKKISKLSTPQTALALFKIPQYEVKQEPSFSIALDGVRDPGNLGTIIRLCDWFGVSHLICSTDTVDCYNPKVVQASMGSITRVKILYTDLPEYLRQTKLPVYGTFMDGNSIYKKNYTPKGILVMGNEANGISTQVEAFTTEKISIPQFGENLKTESLNVATASAILLSEFKRSL
ncbi:TrmH family RNA methyltransferase [Mesonia aquimarina]|uniref:TrmH family RNA methyltransferase n=1 Tax=Mesonia aquimarina TaxID=1504967 RepID=UPI000EF5EEFB|nr:RNA methyltransferase [Mesonia aquimarina]